MKLRATERSIRDGLRVLLEVCIASLPSGLLLTGYLLAFSGSQAAVLPHMQLLAMVLLAPWFGLRLLRTGDERAWRWTLALLGTSVWLICIAYAALVLIGLQSWGRVVTWVLIETYLHDLPGLFDALGLRWWHSLVLCLLTGTPFFALLARHLRDDPVRAIARRSDARIRWLAAFSLLLMAPAQLVRFADEPALAAGEPLALTFYSDRQSQSLQSHVRSDAPLLEQEAALAAQAYKPRAGGAERPRNVVLIVVDALRADAIRLDSQGTLKDYAMAPEFGGAQLLAAWPMWAGCAESSCGLLGMARSRSLHQMTAHDLSLMEVLRQHGYQVKMLLGGDHTNFYGLRQAYGKLDSYQDATSFAHYYANDDRLVLDELARWPRWNGTPLMLQLHLMSAHPLGLRLEARAGQRRPSTNYISAFWRGRWQERDVQAQNYYANGVQQLGWALSEALGSLRAKGYLDDALVVITGDHGESLGEHGEYGHAQGVHEPALKVPFVLLRFGESINPLTHPQGLVSQLDITPTLADLVGVPFFERWQGRSLAREQTTRRDWLLFQQGSWVGAYDLRSAGRVYKYVRNLSTGSERAHEILSDPGELQNLLMSVDGQATLLPEWRRATAQQVAARVR